MELSRASRKHAWPKRAAGRPKPPHPDMRDPWTVGTLGVFSSRVMAVPRSMKGPNPVLVVAHSGVFRVFGQKISLRMNSAASAASA